MFYDSYYLTQVDNGVRRISVYLAHHAFHTSWIPTRYLLLLACSDEYVPYCKKLVFSQMVLQTVVFSQGFAH